MHLYFKNTALITLNLHIITLTEVWEDNAKTLFRVFFLKRVAQSRRYTVSIQNTQFCLDEEGTANKTFKIQIFNPGQDLTLAGKKVTHEELI